MIETILIRFLDDNQFEYWYCRNHEKVCELRNGSQLIFCGDLVEFRAIGTHIQLVEKCNKIEFDCAETPLPVNRPEYFEVANMQFNVKSIAEGLELCRGKQVKKQELPTQKNENSASG